MYIGEYIDPEIEFARFGSEAPDFTGEWQGIDGLRQATVEYLNVWEDYRFEVERMIDAILTLRDGLIVRWEYYWERADALEAAGVAG